MRIPFFNKKKHTALTLADEHVQNGHLTEALPIYREYGNRAGITQIADLCLSRHNYKQAAELYFETDNQEGLNQISEIYLQSGKLSELEKIWKRMEGLSLKDAYCRAGHFLLAHGDYTHAERYLLQAGQQDDALQRIAEHYLSRKDTSNALRLFRAIGNTNGIRAAAYQYLEQSALDQAEKLFVELGDSEGVSTCQKQRRNRSETHQTLFSDDAPDPEDPHFLPR